MVRPLNSGNTLPESPSKPSKPPVRLCCDLRTHRMSPALTRNHTHNCLVVRIEKSKSFEKSFDFYPRASHYMYG